MPDTRNDQQHDEDASGQSMSSYAESSDSDSMLSRALAPDALTGALIDRFRLTDVAGEDAFSVRYAGVDTTTGNAVLVEEYFPVWLSERDTDGVNVRATSRRRAKAFTVARELFEAEA